MFYLFVYQGSTDLSSWEPLDDHATEVSVKGCIFLKDAERSL